MQMEMSRQLCMLIRMLGAPGFSFPVCSHALGSWGDGEPGSEDQPGAPGRTRGVNRQLMSIENVAPAALTNALPKMADGGIIIHF